MNLKTLHKLFTGVLIAFCLMPSCAFSQAYQFKSYGVDNGISQPYVYTINQDKNGYLWLGTGEGLCKFDGIKFVSYTTADGIAENFVTASFKDKERNLWLGFNQGSVTCYDGKKFRSINTSGFSKSPVTCIIADDQQNIWCSTQNDGVFKISKDFEVSVFKLEFDKDNIFSIAFTRNNQLLVATSNGLKLYDLNNKHQRPEFVNTLSVIPQSQIKCIVPKRNTGSFWIGTQDEGLFLLTPLSASKTDFRATPIGAGIKDLELKNIQDIYEDNMTNLWVATFGSGLVKLQLSAITNEYATFQQFSENNGLENKYVKSIYADHEGNIWVGTYGSGVVHITDNYFTFYNTISGTNNNISVVFADNYYLWLGTDNSLVRMDMSNSQRTVSYSKSNGFTDDKVTAICQLDTDRLVIGTEKQGAFIFETKKNKFTKLFLDLDDLSNSINTIVKNRNILWIATKNGLFRIDEQNNITTHYTTEQGLPHNNLTALFADNKNTLWIAAHSNYLAYISSGSENIQLKKIYDGSDLITVTGILQDARNDLWISTMGNGVFKLGAKDITRYTTQNGLSSNYCYSIVNDGSNNIWIGHRMALSRIRTQKDVIDIFNKNEGILCDFNNNAVFKDYAGNAWFGTTTGVLRFDPHKDKKNMIPPILNITSIKINDKDYEDAKEIRLDYDNYKLRIDFIGISFKSNSNIVYQYKLEGVDADWSDKTKNTFVQYGKVTDGDYTFLLKAFNNDGVGNSTPLSIHIEIAKPVWRRPWFVVVVIILIFYVIYFYIKLRERNHRKFQAQLQKSLNEKTREVILQKEEIEKKNKDITDSIRYAKRIQDALLPQTEKLKRVFPESFIFFQPRDIVSGDFYWFELYGNKLIIACADATGHGVPGAFMSMIGSTLLKDITSRPEVTSPSHALEALDEEIKILLQQNEDDDHEQTYDSVDVIICEIDTETFHVRLCSTRRSVFVASDDKLLTFKKDVTDIQNYETIDVQLKKGDLVYMFTDGYPDQFGGDNGKKIKIANTRLMLNDIKDLPTEKQAMIVDRFFNRWKEGFDQVDDVLFIGIKL